MSAYIIPAMALIVSTWIFLDMLDDTIKDIKAYYNRRK